jgi:hypothetical protein
MSKMSASDFGLVVKEKEKPPDMEVNVSGKH